MVQVVWFKRDLRVADHEPLNHAIATGEPVVCLYVIEPELWRQPDASGRHWAFVRESLLELRRDLEARGGTLVVRVGDVVTLLGRLHQQHGVGGLWSHQETGNGWTFERDKGVGAWARAHAVVWTEIPQNGVVRALKSRDGWAARWDRTMACALVNAPDVIATDHSIKPGDLPEMPDLGLRPDPCPGRQPGGRAAGLVLLSSFLNQRGESYHREMSSPLSAADACSRLSVHLAYGTLSMREVAQATWSRLAEARAMPTGSRGTWLTALRAFVGRLHWHCHFMQKLESAPRIEFQNVHRAYDGLRDGDFDQARFEAWTTGHTGFPFVDACMRSLIATGWINFRMRAMLMAFASYHLWLHWRPTGMHLARVFTDYEPGIHWPQVQMQSGTTGTNTVRIYNPVKQSTDQDPRGTFIRQWVPEVRGVPDDYVHEPWRMPLTVQAEVRCRIGVDYPQRIVDHEAAARTARERVWAIRRGEAFRTEAKALLEKHGSRRRRSAGPNGPRSTKSVPAPAPQLALDLQDALA